ncbi:MAG: dephospho-CoA kinase [Bacteroidetes bacterium HGW-Bacteroidetes-6]|jgi:dephospho-CoA kinase|nr:MAG: dephospho-CoA kinase [Bacteroidetes bacterium HGW-Bacteroidetes-6]
MKIAITGNIGSGKTTVAKVFGVLGFEVLNADILAKSLYEIPAVKTEVERILQKKITTPSGETDYALIASEYFSGEDIYKAINDVLYPALQLLIEEKICSFDNKNVVVEAAMLFEAGLDSFFDKIICISAPDEIRIARVAQRSCMTRKQFFERERRQLPQKQKEEKADIVIFNDESNSLIEQVEKIVSRL